jgi:hypothetical protein
MSKVKIEGNASGTGTFTIAAPNTNTDYSLTLPETTGGEFVVTDSSGRVGIGTSSPATTLDVSNVSRYTFDVSNSYTLQTSLNAAGSAFANDYKNAAQHIWQTSGTERMRIDSSGNVGVGTSSPSTKLHLEGTDSSPTALRLTNTTASTGKSWQITSTNAGLLQLATIPGVADYLTVNSSGNVGVGTSSPSARLQVANATSSGTVIFQHPGNASFGTILTLETTGGTDDPVLSFKNYNGGSPVYYGISGTDNGSLAFKSGASTGGFGAERMRIDSSGNLRINSTTGSGRVYIYENNAAFYSINFDSSNNTGTQYYLEFKRQGVQAGYLTSNSSTTVQLNNTSDVRLKENIEDAGSALASVMAAQVRQFDWKENRSPHQDFGFVAQELVNIIPEAVTVGTDNEDGTIKMPWGIDYSHIVPRLVKSIQEQQELIQSLTDRIAALEA